MDITTVLAVISSAAVLLAWFILPSKIEAPASRAESMSDMGVAEMAA
jgi:hypothetical protein